MNNVWNSVKFELVPIHGEPLCVEGIGLIKSGTCHGNHVMGVRVWLERLEKILLTAAVAEKTQPNCITPSSASLILKFNDFKCTDITDLQSNRL